MAAGDVTVTMNGVVVDTLAIKVVKGNELTDLITETFDGEDFAPTLWDMTTSVGAGSAIPNPMVEHGMSRGRDRSVSQYVKKQIALLGARGDYALFEMSVHKVGTVAYAIGEQKNFLVQALDFTGVPVAVQHAIFGKFSPFLTPTQPVSPGMIRGIDRQEIEFVNAILLTANDTYKDQKIRGISTPRLQAKVDVNDDPTKITIKAKPLADGVFVIPRGALIWAGDGSTATKSSGTT